MASKINTNLFASLIIFAVSVSACEAQTRLPKEMPADVRMSFALNGGMSPYYTNIEIEGDTLVYKEKMPDTRGKEVVWTAKISKEDKANLYRLFIENKFDQIVNEKQKSIVYDAGSEGISISFASNSFNVQSGANFPLSSKNQTRYQTIANEFEKLAKKYSTQKQVIKIQDD